tara:strand:+ start:179 stop:478 length:300 start_codon:yes stop_codon:yes gene_type:complete
MKKFLVFIFLAFILSSCQTVTKKIDEKVSEEEALLSQWLNKSEEELKIKFGKPDQVELKINSKNRFYIYTKEKLKIKCERIFEIDPGNKVIGFSSKNCF